eukprot:1542950-Lingulodinium_polyedra.AAC.1
MASAWLRLSGHCKAGRCRAAIAWSTQFGMANGNGHRVAIARPARGRRLAIAWPLRDHGIAVGDWPL